MFLSIIIPVYNAEKYLKDCVDSLIGLPRYLSVADSEMEVILVDDGSKDDSGCICDEFLQNHYSFGVKVLHQQNQGVSAARNEGLKIATGEWVWFVDADDYIKFYSEKPCLLKGVVADFIVTSFVWEENDVGRTFISSSGEVPYNLWRCWFRKEFVQRYNMKFTVGRKYAEDQEFILKYLVNKGNTNSVALPDLFYHYTLRPGSAMTRSGIKLKQAKDLCSVICSIAGVAVKKKSCCERWVMWEMKRMIKTLIVVLIR